MQSIILAGKIHQTGSTDGLTARPARSQNGHCVDVFSSSARISFRELTLLNRINQRSISLGNQGEFTDFQWRHFHFAEPLHLSLISLIRANEVRFHRKISVVHEFAVRCTKFRHRKFLEIQPDFPE